MFARMGSSWNSATLLGERRTVVTLDDSLAISYTVKHVFPT